VIRSIPLELPRVWPPHSSTAYLCRVEAGFPSPADDHLDRDLDLNEHVVRRPSATFFTRVAGEAGPGDLFASTGQEEDQVLMDELAEVQA
jgi:SOS-response transcriptional repressor LexA